MEQLQKDLLYVKVRAQKRSEPKVPPLPVAALPALTLLS